MKRRLRIAAPIALVIIGVYLLIGCIPIPATRQLQPDLTPRPEHYVGNSKDDPVRLGYTHIDDAFIFLSQRVSSKSVGSPGFFTTSAPRIGFAPRWSIHRWSVSEDRSRFSFGYSIRTATWIMPLCFSAYAETAARWITFDVNADGVITHATTSDHPVTGQVVEVGRWLEIFDSPTRHKLVDAGVLPSDDEIRTSQEQIDRYHNRLRPHPASMPSTRP